MLVVVVAEPFASVRISVLFTNNHHCDILIILILEQEVDCVWGLWIDDCILPEGDSDL